MGKKQKAGKVNKRIVGKAKNSAENEAEKREEGSSSAQASRPIRPRHKDDKPAVGGTSLVPKGGSDAFEHVIGSSVCGLVNLGNTCYLNSCVQTLLAAPVCQEYFQTTKHQIGRSPGIGAGLEVLFSATRDTPKPTDQPRKGKKQPATTTLNPHKLYAAICQHAPQFKGRRQQDSHEVLRILVDGLKEECSRRETPHKSGKQKDVSEASLDGGGASFVESVFGGDLSSCLRCEVCGYESAMTEPFLDLSLPIPEDGPPPEPRSGGPGIAQEVEESSVAKRHAAKDAKPPSTPKQKKRLEKRARQISKDTSLKIGNGGGRGNLAEGLATPTLRNTPGQPQGGAELSPAASVDTWMQPSEAVTCSGGAEPSLVPGEPSFALGEAALEREDSFASELGEVDSDDADTGCLPPMPTANALPVAVQPDSPHEDDDETDRWGGLPVDSGLPMDPPPPPPPPSRPTKPTKLAKLEASGAGGPGDFSDSIDALYGGPASGDHNRKLRGRDRTPKGSQAKLPTALGTVPAVPDTSNGAAVAASSRPSLESTSMSGTTWELCLQTCLDAYFAPEEVCYTCPRSQEHPPAAASNSGHEVEPSDNPAELEEGSSDGKATRSRRVRFSGDNPKVFLIEKSAVQRGLDFRAAMEGDDYFRRYMTIDNVELAVKATLRRAWAAAHDGVPEEDQLKLELRYANANRMITLPLLPAVDIGRLQDPQNEGDQAELYAKATLLLDFIVDVANGYGLDALHRLENSHMQLLPDAAHPHAWMVRCVDSENGLWEYPDRSAVPSDPTDDTDLFGEGSASDDDLQPLANAASADDYGSGALSSAEDSSTAEHISTSEDVSTGSSETADEACSSACSSAATRVTSDVSPCPSETAALGGGDNSLGESMQKLALEGTDASEDTGREAGPGGPRGDPAPGTGGRDVDSTQPGPDSRQGVGAGSVCGDRVLRGTSGAVGSGDLRSEPDVAACRAHDRKAGSCGLHQPLGRGQGTEHVGRACACQSGPPEESGSAAESSGRSDESGGGSKIGSSQQQGSEPSPSFPEGSGDVGDGSDVGRVMDVGSVLDDVGAMAAGGESAAGPPQGVLKSSASGAEAKVAEGKAWRTDRIHRAPTLLVLHLKRFARTPRGGIQKISAHVPFPFDLDVSKYVDPKGSDGQGARYTLIGIVEHQGGLNGGHYIAYVQRGLHCDLPSAPGMDGVTVDAPSGQPSEGTVVEEEETEHEEEVREHEEVACAREGSLEFSHDSEDILSSSVATPVVKESTWEDLLDDEDVGKEDGGSHDKDGASCGEGESGPGPASAKPSSSSKRAGEGGGRSVGTREARSSLEGNESRSGKDVGKGRKSGATSSGTSAAGNPGQSVRRVQWKQARAKKATQPLCWYRVSDTLVSRVTEDAVASCQAYILLYMRV